ncbi:dTDP-4-amino-4,6-dideoxy-D-glucose aminotransferase VioA [Sessilibacter sp. MAH1]
MIPLLVPDLPSVHDILPWLKQIDENRWYSNYGPLCQEFEHEITGLLKRENPDSVNSFSMVSTCSGTTALEVALSAYRFRPGTKVLLPSLTFPATATAVIRSGLIPVLVDVDPNSWILTPEIAEQALIKSGAKVVIPVAAYGCKINEELWQLFAEKNNCRVLIDAAGAFPSQTPRQKVDICYSFHATKSLGIGEGGGIVSVDNLYLDICRDITNFGFSNGTIHTAGMNAKLSEYHAAIGLAQIARFNEIKLKRQALYATFRSKLEFLSDKFQFQNADIPKLPTLFVIKLGQNAKDLAHKLHDYGITTRQWYCPALHNHQAFKSYVKNLSLKYGSLINSQILSEQLLGLPFHPFLSNTDIDYMCSSLAKALVENSQSSRAMTTVA